MNREKETVQGFEVRLGVYLSLGRRCIWSFTPFEKGLNRPELYDELSSKLIQVIHEVQLPHDTDYLIYDSSFPFLRCFSIAEMKINGNNKQ